MRAPFAPLRLRLAAPPRAAAARRRHARRVCVRTRDARRRGRAPSAPWPRPAAGQGPWLALTRAGGPLARGPRLSASGLAGRGVDLAFRVS